MLSALSRICDQLANSEACIPVVTEASEICEVIERLFGIVIQDLHELETKALADLVYWDAAQQSRVDDARGYIERACLTPQGKYQVFIIDTLDALEISAMHALLKTLEEWARNSWFLATCQRRDQVLLTLRSRFLWLETSKSEREISADLRQDLDAFLAGHPSALVARAMGEIDHADIEAIVLFLQQSIKQGTIRSAGQIAALQRLARSLTTQESGHRYMLDRFLFDYFAHA